MELDTTILGHYKSNFLKKVHFQSNLKGFQGFGDFLRKNSLIFFTLEIELELGEKLDPFFDPFFKLKSKCDCSHIFKKSKMCDYSHTFFGFLKIFDYSHKAMNCQIRIMYHLKS